MRKELGGNVTIVVIAHRLSTIKDADRIIVMKEGRLVEDGSHESLLREFPEGIYGKFVSEEEQGGVGETSAKENQGEESADIANQDCNEKLDQVDPNQIGTTLKVEKENIQANSELLKNSKEDKSKKDQLQKETQMMEKAEELRKAKEEETKKAMAHYENPKTRTKAVRAKVFGYTKPFIMVIFGALLTIILAALGPMFGVLIVKNLTSMTSARYLEQSVTEAVKPWVIFMLSLSFIALISKAVVQFFFTYITEEVTYGVRRDLYKSIMSKHIGWHDNKNHSSGNMTAILASEV